MPGNAILDSGIRICATATRVLIKVARRLADRTGSAKDCGELR